MTSKTSESDLHGLISAFAGRVPDKSMAMMRSSLVLEPETALEMLVDIVERGRVVLTPEERGLALRVCAAHRVDTGSIARAKTAPLDFVPYTFSAPDLQDDWADSVDEIAILAAAGADVDPGEEVSRIAPDLPLQARAMWRVARSSSRATVDVRLVEIARDADPVLITWRMQERIAESDQAPPRVEVFLEGAVLTLYQQQALTAAALVWVAEPPVIPQLAPVFDGADPRTGPFFRPERSVVPEADREVLLSFLRGGERVLESFGWLDDIVTDEKRCVPVGYRSDGAWVWADASLYYLERHGLAPDADLCAHIGAGPGPPQQLTRLQRHLVFETVTSPDPDEVTK